MNAKSVVTSPSLFKASVLIGLCALFSLRAAPAESNPFFAPRSAAKDLQLVVAAPASLSLMGVDDVPVVLTNLIETVFQQSGFRGHLVVNTGSEPSRPDQPTLQVYLLDWNITGAGNVDCSFTATLATTTGLENLGVFYGTSLPMFGLRNPFNRAQAFDQAATNAIDNLYGELREKNLLPASIL
jgi:hypothetical protein